MGQDPKLSGLLYDVLYVSRLVLLPDTLQNALIGILKALNKGKEALIRYIIVYYILGIPFTFYLSFIKKMYTPGLWYGFLASVSILCLLLILLIARTDWDQEIKIIVKELNVLTGQSDESG